MTIAFCIVFAFAYLLLGPVYGSIKWRTFNRDTTTDPPRIHKSLAMRFHFPVSTLVGAAHPMFIRDFTRREDYLKFCALAWGPCLAWSIVFNLVAFPFFALFWFLGLAIQKLNAHEKRIGLLPPESENQTPDYEMPENRVVHLREKIGHNNAEIKRLQAVNSELTQELLLHEGTQADGQRTTHRTNRSTDPKWRSSN